MPDRVLVTGAAGYVGAPLCQELLAAGWRVRGLDCLLHGQEHVASALERDGVELVRGDIRDPGAREEALAGAAALVHLAAIVGDPACAHEPELAAEVNIAGSEALLADAAGAGISHIVFASTCSNYGRSGDPETPVDERAQLRPVSLYAEQKVAIERLLLPGLGGGERSDLELRSTCLRLATIYGVAPRMRFDLTVNEFTRELWAGHNLEVYGQQFWRPYVHVRDAARAVHAVLGAEPAAVDGEVFNVGATAENYRKLDLVAAIREQIHTGTVSYVERDSDPRDYRVSCEKITRRLAFHTTMTVAEGITEVAAALSAGAFPEPFDDAYRNSP